MKTENPFGGVFLVEEAAPDSVFTPEDFCPEDRLVGQAAADFLRREVLPHTERIEQGDHALMKELMHKAGAAGLLGADVPEVYGGSGFSIATSALIAEKINWQQSFALTHEAHTVIATLPLLYFGTHEQKARYLPKLATGEWIGSFALSEANSGSDALAAEAHATLSDDGTHYHLNGTKMWITNTGFAQLFTVFAKVGGEKFTAFLVERDFPGLSFGLEEVKLGMRGTSTRRVILDNVPVPVENAMEVGKGQYAAFCALNLGRFKLEAGAVGGLKETLAVCARYAGERRAFGKFIGQNGLIQHKLAEMAARTFTLETMVYRLAGDLDGVFDEIIADAPDASPRFHRAAEEYTLECNIVKVIGSELYSRMTDEAIQIHGGYGYTEKFPVARAWRDQRLLRIGEGANEIVRIAIVNTLLRREKQGRLTLPDATDALLTELAEAQTTEPLDRLVLTAQRAKALGIALVRRASAQLGAGLLEAQEITGTVADVLNAAYALDSLALRCRKQARSATMLLMGEIAARDFADEAVLGAKSALDTLTDGDWRDAPRAPLARLIDALERPWANTMHQRRTLATLILEKKGYPI